MRIESVKKILKEVRNKRPILECINYNHKTQLISVCNSFTLIQEQSKRNIDQTFNINVFDLQINNSIYPEVENFKNPSHKFVSIENIEIVLIDNKMYYKLNGIDDILFDKVLVDNSFKCLSSMTDNTKNKYKNLENINTEYLGIDNNVKLIYHNYNTNDFVLVLGVRK